MVSLSMVLVVSIVVLLLMSRSSEVGLVIDKKLAPKSRKREKIFGYLLETDLQNGGSGPPNDVRA